MSSDSEDENNDLEELEDVEWVSSSDDATKDEESESSLSDQLYSNVGQYDVDSLDHMSSFAKAVQEKTVSKEKRTSDRRVLDPDDTKMLKNPFVNPAPSRETLLLMLREKLS